MDRRPSYWLASQLGGSSDDEGGVSERLAVARRALWPIARPHVPPVLAGSETMAPAGEAPGARELEARVRGAGAEDLRSAQELDVVVAGLGDLGPAQRR